MRTSAGANLPPLVEAIQTREQGFTLLVSRNPFVFWDLCGIEFCVLKDVPSGLRGNGSLDYHRGVAQEMRRINKEIPWAVGFDNTE